MTDAGKDKPALREIVIRFNGAHFELVVDGRCRP
jgi:hypothetical protein